MQHQASYPRSSRYLLIALTFILIMLAWSQDRTRRFIGHHDWDNIYWVTAAENFKEYGLISTRFQTIVNAYQAPREEWDINQHHPPCIPLFAYVGLEAFGGSEFAARLLPIFISLLTAALLYQFAQGLYGRTVALLSVFFFSFTPLMIYFSAKIGHEQFTLPLMLSVLIIYKIWLEHPRKWHIPTLALLAGIGIFISWAWYLFLALMGLHALMYGRKARILQLWPIIAGILVAVVGFVVLLLWQQGDAVSALQEGFLNRTANASNDPITISAWMMVVGTRFLWMPTPVVTLLGLIGLHKLFKQKPIKEADTLLVMPAIVSLIYCAVFWEATYRHDYLLYYLFASLSVWAAIGFFRVLYAYGQPPKLAWGFILYSFLALFLIGSLRWTTQLFSVDVVKERYEWGILIGKATEPDEITGVNLEDYGAPHLSYYSKRRVHFGVTLEDVFDPSSSVEYGFYIYCEEDEETLPSSLATYPYQYDQLGDDVDCYLIDLKP